jgi:hypothetical protein
VRNQLSRQSLGITDSDASSLSISFTACVLLDSTPVHMANLSVSVKVPLLPLPTEQYEHLVGSWNHATDLFPLPSNC